MARSLRLLLAIPVLALSLAAPAAAATTTWTSLPAPWYGPTVVGSTNDAPGYRLHTGSSVAVVGHYAYTVEATLNRLTVVDVSDRTQPIVVSSLQDSAHMDTPTWIVVEGSFAYVTSKGIDNNALANSSLSIYDISDPLHPAFMGSVTNDTRLYGAYGLQVVGSKAYIAAQGCVTNTPCVNTYPGGNALTIVDVSDPRLPRITGSVSSLPRTQHLDSITVVGNRAYGTAFYTQRLTSFDVSDPAHPTILGTRADPLLTFANDVQVQGHYAYVVDQSTTGARLTVVDIANPAVMPIVGSVLDNTRLNYAYRLRVNSRFAFVAAPKANALTVVDLANPANPQVVASVADPVLLANPIGFDLVGDTAYVAAYCPKLASGGCDPAGHGALTTIDVSAFGVAAPDTTITGAPEPVTRSAAASITFTSTRAGASFACSLDGAAPTSCTSPQSYTGLADGTHTFTVSSTSLAGASDPTPATVTWRVDTQAPDTTITSAPSGTVTATTAGIDFNADDPTATFECRLDGGAWSSCTTPAALSGLADGQHTYDVRATDLAGNTDPTPATATWTVDTQAPDTTITSAPSGTVTAGSASIDFSSDDPGATFECRLDSGPWSSCTTPAALSGLADGQHTYDVRATDVAGNTDPTPATATWTVETQAPDTSITNAPSGTVKSTAASIDFTADDPAATFECRLDGGAWSPCTTPAAFGGFGGFGSLSDGVHTFDVRATDVAGNTDPTPASATWTVDTQAPDTTITTAPSGTVTSASASIGFTADESATFECRLDGGAWSACTTPAALSGLGDGQHTYDVRATDVAGNTDPTPATATWTVDTHAPDTTITSAPSGTVTATSASIDFNADDPAATFECRLDSGTWSSCTAPQTYSSLAPGPHTVAVRATDAAGNVEPAPATASWTVAAAVPGTTITSAPSGTVRSRTATIDFNSDDPAATFECRLDGAAWQACTAPVTLSGLADGVHAFDVRATGAGGTDPTPDSATWRVDATAPTATMTTPSTVSQPLTVTFSEDVRNVTTTNLTLTARGAGAPVAALLDCRAADASAVSCATGPVAKATLTPSATLIVGQYYTAAENPAGASTIIDLAGNDATPSTKAFREQQTLDEAGPAVTQAWADKADAAALGGSYALADRSGASASYVFSGPTVAWVTLTGPAQGSASVYVDGKLKATPNQNAASTTYGVRRTYTGLGAGSHTIKIVAGTTGAVAVDGFDVGAVTQPSPTLAATWQSVSAAAASSGAYVQDDVAGATVSLTFRGTRIDWFTTTGPSGGLADVAIDGTSVGTVDTYSAATAYLVKRSYPVPDAVHTITITVLGQSQPASAGKLVAVDRFTVG